MIEAPLRIGDRVRDRREATRTGVISGILGNGAFMVRWDGLDLKRFAVLPQNLERLSDGPITNEGR